VPGGTRRDGQPGRRPGGGGGGPADGRPQQKPPSGGGNEPLKRSVAPSQLPSEFCYGINAVSEAISGEMVRTLYHDSSRENPRVQQLVAFAREQGVAVEPLQRQGWSKALSAEQHQGIAAKLLPLPARYLDEIVAHAGTESCILVLDRIQDPQNLGAILRTAAAAGVDAVVLPKAGAAPVTAAVHRASAGQSLRVPIVEGENLAAAITMLKDHGYWVVGCDADGSDDATQFAFPHKRAIVLGNEAEGMRRLVRESCDYIVSIPMAPGVESLNVSTAAAIVLYLAKAHSAD
jgi:23S rRNA (guanosine2251-2'-O)-methyltransferase